MIGQYRVNVYNPNSGALEATIEDFQRLELKHVINGVTFCNIRIDGSHPAIEWFVENAPIEVWRQVPGYIPQAIPASRQREGNWYSEWDGLFIDFSNTVYSNGRETYTAYFSSLLDLARRREILWYATVGASESKKVAIPSQTAIYEYVEENMGASAVVGVPGTGRLFTGTIGGLTVPVLIGGGAVWSGQRAWRNLLETIQKIGNFGEIDFDIVSAGGNNFVFETYPDQLGSDRTVTGLDPITGLNAAGNPPVIFSLDNDNVLEITHSSSRGVSKNVIATTGKGEYLLRGIGTAIDLTDIDAARINQRELVRNASTQDDPGELDTVADEWLVKLQATEDFKFTPFITDSTIYGVNYWWGDRMTARFKTLERNKRLTAVTIISDRTGEHFTGWEFKTLP